MWIISNNEYTQNLSEIDKLLQKNIGKDVSIHLKNNIVVHGKLKNFDQHLNLSLKEGSVKSSEKVEHLHDILLRGSDVLMVSLQS